MLQSIRAALASSDPATLIGSAAIAAFVLVWSWRKFFPSSWNWLEMRIPLIDRIKSDAIWTFVWKTVQTIPGALIGAAMTALASGGDLKKTLLGALAGPVAAIGHEVLKAYKGQTSKPGNRIVPPYSLSAIALCLSLGLLIPGCAAFAAISPWVAQAAVIISDAVNAINAAEALLPSLHLGADEQAKAETLIARLRAAASAAAKADAGLQDLTAEQLDASLADFRQAWVELEKVFAAKRVGASLGSSALPKPLALRRVAK